MAAGSWGALCVRPGQRQRPRLGADGRRRHTLLAGACIGSLPARGGTVAVGAAWPVTVHVLQVGPVPVSLCPSVEVGTLSGVRSPSGGQGREDGMWPFWTGRVSRLQREWVKPRWMGLRREVEGAVRWRGPACPGLRGNGPSEPDLPWKLPQRAAGLAPPHAVCSASGKVPDPSGLSGSQGFPGLWPRPPVSAPTPA